MSCVLGKQSTAPLLIYLLHCFLQSTKHAYTKIQSYASFFTLQLTEIITWGRKYSKKHISQLNENAMDYKCVRQEQGIHLAS